MLRAVAALALALLLGSCATLAPAAAGPRLVVLFIVDGLPQRQVTAYRDQLAPDGLARFLDRGTWFADAHVGHAYTVTAPGHATVLTGAYPHRSGIIGNAWLDLQAESLGDVLRRRDARSRVIAISGKERGAVLPAGKAGTAYWYMEDSGRFTSSTNSLQQPPAWVEAFHAAKPADRWFQAEWRALLPEAAYARSLADDQPWFGRGGGRLPMRMGSPADDAPGPRYYAALLASPFADALTLDFARTALAGEQLGADDAPDLLSISLSGHDHVNHRWSAESRLSQDHLLQLDRMLQAFFADLDRTVGRDNYLALLTSDHGFMQAPEVSRARGLDAGRISSRQVLTAVNAVLDQRFGVPGLVATTSSSALVLDRRLLAEHRLDADGVAEAARAALLAQPGFFAAYTRRELASGSRAGAPLFEAMRRSWHAGRSGDVQYALKPHWMFGTAAATHGSPWDYDSHVPLMLWGPRWVAPARVGQRVEHADIAPTLARLLGVPAPAASEGRPLPLARP